nr:hypothetical protein [Fodinicola feengrottensis]
MNDADVVRGLQRLADLDPDVDHLGDRPRSVPAQDFRVRAAFAIFHDDVRVAGRGGAGVDDRHDVRVAGQPHGEVEFALDVVCGRLFVDSQHLDRHHPADPLLDAPVDERRAAVRDQLQLAVADDAGRRAARWLAVRLWAPVWAPWSWRRSTRGHAPILPVPAGLVRK